MTTEQAGGRARRRPLARNSARIESGVSQWIACSVPAGTHTARCGGTTHAPAAVATVITPARA